MSQDKDTPDPQPGNYIIWQDEEIRSSRQEFVSPGMVGKVISVRPPEDKASENPQTVKSVFVPSEIRKPEG
ncbi:hypothetical protein MYX82_10155 [Acidobacteria bacterium AH-259-D05]|nr:hypothetical protein [Acidobacteria bacterium AH-259-D05]